MIRDLKGTMERENAEMSAFITLEKPTPAMTAESASAGFYHSEVMNRDYPRMQILTIRQLLKDQDCFKIPPGGGLMGAPKFISKTNSQKEFFK